MSWRRFPREWRRSAAVSRSSRRCSIPASRKSLVAHPGAGAIATFIGTVRDPRPRSAVTHLEYEAYAPAAELSLAQIGDEIQETWGIEHVAIVHRVGSLDGWGGERRLLSVASAHREAVFAACRYGSNRSRSRKSSPSEKGAL